MKSGRPITEKTLATMRYILKRIAEEDQPILSAELARECNMAPRYMSNLVRKMARENQLSITRADNGQLQVSCLGI